MENKYYKLSDGKKCKELLNAYPNYKVFWRSGYAFKGALKQELDRNTTYKRTYPIKEEVSFEKEMEYRYNWSAAIDIEVLHDKKELHFNGFSENDLY